MHRLDCPSGIEFIEVQIASLNVWELNNVASDSKHLCEDKEVTEKEPTTTSGSTAALNVLTASHSLKMEWET